jgi:hypothetical protein
MAMVMVDWLSSLPILFIEVVSIVSATFPQCLEYVNGEVTTIDCLSSATQLRKQPFDFSHNFSHLEFCQVLPRPSQLPFGETKRRNGGVLPTTLESHAKGPPKTHYEVCVKVRTTF